MTISARLLHIPAADRRSSPRRKLCLGASLQSSGDAVTILDLSSTGMLIETAAKLVPFDSLQIDLPEVGFTQAIIIWNSGRYYGCEFNEPVPKAAISAALLRSPPGPSDELATALPEPRTITSTVAETRTRADAEHEGEADNEKATLSVRLRVIFGSAIVLWALIIWAIGSFIN